MPGECCLLFLFLFAEQHPVVFDGALQASLFQQGLDAASCAQGVGAAGGAGANVLVVVYRFEEVLVVVVSVADKGFMAHAKILPWPSVDRSAIDVSHIRFASEATDLKRHRRQWLAPDGYISPLGLESNPSAMFFCRVRPVRAAHARP